MPRSVLIIVLFLCTAAALLGFLAGRQVTDRDIAGIVNAVAEDHVRRYGGDVTACLGWLQDDGVLLEVKCGETLYRVNRAGVVQSVVEPEI